MLSLNIHSPQTAPTLDRSATAASRCPFLASQERLKAMQEAATADTTTLQTTEGSDLTFRAQKRGLDFWNKDFKEVSAEEAIERACKHREVQGRRGQAGPWTSLQSMEELQALLHQAQKDAPAQRLAKTSQSTAESAAQSAARCPFQAGLQQDTSTTRRIGLLTFAKGMARHYDNPLGFLQEFHAKYGRSFEVNTPTHGKFLFDTRSEVLTDALSQTDSKDEGFKKSTLQTHGAAFLIGDKNMFSSSGDDWKAIRKGITPHLRATTIQSEETTQKLVSIFDDHIADLRDRVAKAPGGQLEVDARSEMQNAVLDVALQLFMSTKLPKSELRELQQAFNTQMSWLPEETVNPTNISVSKLPGTGELKKAYRTLDGVAERLLQARRNSPEKPDDMLSSFLEAVDPATGKPFSDERIKHEILSLLEAGHETTATMLGWAVLMMSRNPSEYKLLQQEVDEKVGKDQPHFDNLKTMERSDKIVKETLRLYPPFYLFMREAQHDVMIGAPGQQVKVEKGTTVVSSLYETNRDEATWGEASTGYPAHEFHSERFEGQAPERFTPFGTGKRSCAGRVLGMLEGNLMLTRMAHTFDIAPDHRPIETLSDLSIHPKEGTVSLRLRSGIV